MSPVMVLAAFAGACGVLGAWELLAAAEEGRALRSAGRWVAFALAALRVTREPTTPERRRLALLGSGCLLGAGWLVAGPWVGAALAAAGPWVAARMLHARRRRRRAAITAEAPAVARALADALAGGHSVRGALCETASGSGVSGPAGDELRATATALQLGERTEDALSALALRAGGGAYDTLTAAILLQARAGGDLAALLRGLARSLEARRRVEADARSATAQARFTALLVAGLPLVGTGFAELAQPGFVAGLASAPIPALLAGGALVLQVAALLLVRRIGRVGEAWT